ncbi:response regulator transcription factor [Siccirubricoccus sp. KC 17139]|uniref:Response regulator transcription factor n=1 Tax=Siccirubricoccus soli TaxID=2899147 RepID=A0ABT1DAJ5_9PROT|nr:response regulator transcription factor [Siccirubricoccus soli]MCO6418957.1 response regulator transcription factor [Siccirubricoccus soli]MCP2685092.1 response regulator transcription factor [Siccirubricoccus soli]
MTKILVADDDPHIRSVILFALARAGFAAVEAADGPAALAAAGREAPDLVVLDVAMPGMEGTEVCRRLRQTSAVPIIFLSARDEEVDRILGLELGGDDYMVKPFSPRELVARIRARLRRQEVVPPPAPAQGPLALDAERFEASWRGAALPLTVTEFALLRAMAAQPGRVFTREMLMQVAYPDHRIVSDRTIDSHVRHLRAKLAAAGGAPIGTVHGLGYRFLAEEGC